MASSSGTITTLEPVMNAAFEGDVNFRPVVWKAYPANMKKPICAPAQMELRVSPRSELWKNIAITTAASAKRTAMYIKTETSASASFTTTNVAPQMSAVNPRARSARKCLLNMDGRVYALRAGVTRRETHAQQTAA